MVGATPARPKRKTRRVGVAQIRMSWPLPRRHAVRRIEDCWIGDFIGAASLFALCWMLLLLGFAGGIG